MTNSYSLLLYDNVLSGTGFAENITHYAQAWKRSTRFQGGYHRGTFVITGDLYQLLQWFNERLGYHLKEVAGGVTTWEGLIYEMTLEHAGIARRRSLDDMYNYYTIAYTDDSDVSQEDGPYSNTTSIARYGRREELLAEDGVPDATATALANRELKENAWPWARVTGPASGTNESVLQVTVCGYSFTGNWRYETGDGTTVNASAFVSDMIGDCEYLLEGSVDTNALQVVKKFNIDRRCWDGIFDITKLGDSSYNLWRSYVANERKVYYEQADLAYKYTWTNEGLVDLSGMAVDYNPWSVKPAVVRDMLYPVKKAETGSMFSDARDFLIAEVTCAASTGVTFSMGYSEESDIMAAQNEYADWIEDENKPAGGGGGGGSGGGDGGGSSSGGGGGGGGGSVSGNLTTTDTHRRIIANRNNRRGGERNRSLPKAKKKNKGKWKHIPM